MSIFTFSRAIIAIKDLSALATKVTVTEIDSFVRCFE